MYCIGSLWVWYQIIFLLFSPSQMFYGAPVRSSGPKGGPGTVFHFHRASLIQAETVTFIRSTNLYHSILAGDFLCFHVWLFNKYSTSCSALLLGASEFGWVRAAPATAGTSWSQATPASADPSTGTSTPRISSLPPSAPEKGWARCSLYRRSSLGVEMTAERKVCDVFPEGLSHADSRNLCQLSVVLVTRCLSSGSSC